MGEIVTTKPTIQDVIIRPLKQFKDERGILMHMMRSDSDLFEKFGEIYFSFVNKDVVKGWKRHHEMTQCFAVPIGEMKIVVYDDRKGSKTAGVIQEITTGPEKYGLIRIPPKVWYSFKGLASIQSMIVNCASQPHSPDEIDNIKLEDAKHIPYLWN